MRAKEGIDGATLQAIVGRVRAAGGVALVNDDVHLARLADGVHLGQEDAAELDLAQLRSALRDGIIGLSCGTPQEARAADPALIDYVAAGPVFATRAVAVATGLPCAAIGGIGPATIARVRESGVVMAAVISALVCDDPEAVARDLVARWDAAAR